MQRWQLWCHGPVLGQVSGFEPLLDSWNSTTDPAQQRLQAYLDDLQRQLGALAAVGSGLFLDLDIDVRIPDRLLQHHDVENYLAPVVRRLVHQRFTLVSGRKRVGGGSQLIIGVATSGGALQAKDGWQHVSCATRSVGDGKRWKEQQSARSLDSLPLLLRPLELRKAA